MFKEHGLTPDREIQDKLRLGTFGRMVSIHDLHIDSVFRSDNAQSSDPVEEPLHLESRNQSSQATRRHSEAS